MITYRLAGGEKICQSCEKLFRGRFDLVRQGAAFRDTLNDLDLVRAKQIADGMKAAQNEDIDRFGDRYAGIGSVNDVFTVPTFGLDEGGPETVSLGGKPVALVFCEYGRFRQGDRVRILGEEGEKEATVLRLIPCTGAYPFEEYLIAGHHKTECTENTNAWLILEGEKCIPARGDKILLSLNSAK